ncbi:polysaccharide biosynthesis C-terminal domain-containing protein [Luethyella okanaganae]|uniref:NAD-dependent epimerase/dehydratase family protein n=1 Tax=Luethyella okanaganae TaxID=69372 RepID=A0ABW1VB74_9MICO
MTDQRGDAASSRPRIVVTGAGGFLGWHVRAALVSEGFEPVALGLGEGFDLSRAARMVSSAQSVIHLAGMNRGTDPEVHDGNILFARQLSDALALADSSPRSLVYANSVQADNDSPYGRSKRAAGDLLAAETGLRGVVFRDVLLPNIFGEHGRPFYNSVVATFCHLVATGGSPTIDQDRSLTLLHAQNAADLLIGTTEDLTAMTREITVSGVLESIQGMAARYAGGDVPDITDPFDRDLFNTYRSFLFDVRPAIPLRRHADARGSFFEIVRSHGGQGQSSFSTTVPGISRGDHFHRRKVERFTVLSGEAVISIRRLFGDETVEIPVSGAEPVAVDMPTMWSHKITNTGSSELYTSFWANDVFDPASPDTFPEAV